MSPKKSVHLPRRLCNLVNRALAGVIRRRRERLGLTLQQLADSSGLTRQMIGYAEDDERNLSLESIESVAAPLGLTGSEMVFEAECWLGRMPGRCKKCNNCCLHRGRLPWLNAMRECTRPKH
jgi:DNA-binding XRE family transcriptional regulator